jgi:L-gulono-1,4-lactone dehydrogenase
VLRLGSGGTWVNWAGTATATPVAIAHPASTEEVSVVVLEARERGLTVKAVGSGHSFTPVAVTDGVLVQLDRLRGIVSADVPSGIVRVRAGTPLHQLNDALAAVGLAMPNLGDIDRQTISGALGTGTHGTGARFRGLADAVRGVRIVLADGSVHDCDAAHEPDLFEAARVSLGALGIITEVTLQCVPAFLLQAREDPGTLSGTLADLDSLVDGTDHFEFYWFPHTDRVLTKRNTRLPVEAGEDPLPGWRSWLDDDLLSNRVFEVVNRVSTARPAWVPRINRITSRVLSSREFTTASHRVFASQRNVRFREMEYAVPRSAAPDLLVALKALTDQDGLALPFPVEVRFTGADDVWMSTAHGRESAYIAVHQYHRMEHRPYFDAFESMARDVGGRPHWGKLHGRSRADLQPAYPRFDDFVAVRDRVDPERMFANGYLARVLGE